MVLKTHLTLLNTTRLGAAASVLRSKTAAAILEQRRRIEDFNRLTLAVVLSLGALLVSEWLVRRSQGTRAHVL